MPVKTRNGRGGARSGSGPKPKKTSEIRRNRIMLNLTDSEMASLRRAARTTRPSEFAREVVLRYLARRK